MLLQASRDGDLDLVLRLLYTNPFISKQDLQNALWEAVRCAQLEVLRSLLEFRVDPSAEPSPEVSKPPMTLQHTRWTPLVALAVNGSSRRASIVAELLRSGEVVSPCREPVQAFEPIKAHCSPPAGFAAAPLKGCAASRSEGSDSSASAKASKVAAVSQPCKNAPSGSTKGAQASHPHSTCDTVDGAVAGKSPLHGQSVTQADLEGDLSLRSSDDLVSLEARLESRLQAVRTHRQHRLEKQLQSVQRRHKEEQQGRASLEDETLCVICSEAVKSMLFLPCRHLCACASCAASLAICPMCRAPIENHVQCIWS